MAIVLKNRLEVARSEFNQAMKAFRDGRKRHDSAGIAFENGILSMQVDDVMVTLSASGEWSGCAYFSGQVLEALARVPPTEDPVVVEYRAGRASPSKADK